MCAFYLSDVSRGREPNRRLAFGGCLQTLALCSVFILADTLCRFAIYLKTALCRAAPLTSRPSTSSAQINLRGLSSYASFLTNRLSQAAVGCLMLAYSFSPRVHSIPRGPLYNALTASEEKSKRLHLRKSNAADIADNHTRSVKCKALARKRGC